MPVLNRLVRFAMEGFRCQRLNSDGTIARPSRFLGFMNTADLSKVLTNRAAQLAIKIDDGDRITRTVTFPAGVNLSAVTVSEAIAALNSAGFPNITFMTDPFTGRLMGTNSSNVVIGVILTFVNTSDSPVTIPSGNYTLDVSGNPFTSTLSSAVTLAPGGTTGITFSTTAGGVLVSQISIPNFNTVTPALPNGIGIQGGSPSVLLSSPESIIQITGPLARDMDFGQGIKHGGNGLEMISFFNDETIGITLPKNIQDKQEIDIEGANGTITRMVIGASIQGISPVFSLTRKDYFMLEMVQGGILNRETGKYDPPLSHKSESPLFMAEVFSPLFASGSSKRNDVTGYERFLLRSMIGIEGDVPIEAKAWAQYAFNCTATEYIDENGVHHPAWQEQSMSVKEFDALNVERI